MQKNFLYFSGGGLIHKGLDLLLDFFSKQQDLHLYICASVNLEEKFKHIYSKELFNNNNIHTYGFIDLESEKFKTVLLECAFVIMPSCSECMPTSIINAVGNGGLIPILTKASTINIDELSLYIKHLSVESVAESIRESQTFSEEELKIMSNKIGDIVNRTCTIDDYSKNIRKILENIIYENNL